MNRIKLHVYNVPFHLSEGDVKDELSLTASTEECKVFAISCSRPFKMDNGRKLLAPYVFLYVWEKDKDKFLALNGYTYDGKKLSVSVAKNQDKVIQRIRKEAPLQEQEHVPLEEVTEDQHAVLAQDEAEEQLFQMSQETTQE